MNKTIEAKRKLVVKKETLRTLTADELRGAAGGTGLRNNCTNRLSGCISWR